MARKSGRRSPAPGKALDKHNAKREASLDDHQSSDASSESDSDTQSETDEDDNDDSQVDADEEVAESDTPSSNEDESRQKRESKQRLTWSETQERRASGRCFECGEVGHISRNCRSRNKCSRSPMEVNSASARVHQEIITALAGSEGICGGSVRLTQIPSENQEMWERVYLRKGQWYTNVTNTQWTMSASNDTQGRSDGRDECVAQCACALLMGLVVVL